MNIAELPVHKLHTLPIVIAIPADGNRAVGFME